MSDLPRFWNQVHAQDVKFGRAPKQAPSAFWERYLFLGAAVVAATAIWQLYALGQMPMNTALQNSAAILFLTAAGFYLRKRRQRLLRAEKTFYAGKITANG
ncbi:hypothetical protein [Sphingopyxis sp. JAI128]|uniref:hypothetical protein n=1 Tax=Sphingopyxis sp. JAI128 TaxID=2723066 RepID=UPI00160CCDA8|nr:hypothetical protein [Sphingopyxis sp. JAI128]MBB6424581.1 heme A synthase [Sphingopyxis sp. JAI128]